MNSASHQVHVTGAASGADRLMRADQQIHVGANRSQAFGIAAPLIVAQKCLANRVEIGVINVAFKAERRPIVPLAQRAHRVGFDRAARNLGEFGDARPQRGADPIGRYPLRPQRRQLRINGFAPARHDFGRRQRGRQTRRRRINRLRVASPRQTRDCRASAGREDKGGEKFSSLSGSIKVELRVWPPFAMTKRRPSTQLYRPELAPFAPMF